MRTLSAVLGCLAFCIAATTASAGEVAGQITYSGPAPEPTQTEVPASQRACGASIPDESLRVGKKGALQNAVVWLEDAPAQAKAAPGKATLDQVGCRYTPHVLAAQVGDQLELVNSDAVLHNVNAGMAFNYAFPMKGQKRQVELKKAGLLKMKCNAGHPWMSAFVHVFAHPYFAVTGEDGAFVLKDVPPGTYTLTAWHEKLGTKTARVTVGAQGRAQASFDFPEARPAAP